MSYAPIYNKLYELDTRISTLENAPKPEVSVATAPVAPVAPVLVSLSPDTEPVDVSGFATKAELPDVSGFATKAELPDVSGFATKAELPDVSGFATKAELADLYAKFENAVNVIAQLNTKINEANEKIAALEAA
jgi:hypothetical protein